MTIEAAPSTGLTQTEGKPETKTEQKPAEQVKTEQVKTEQVKTEQVKTEQPGEEVDLLTGDDAKGTDGSGAKAAEIEITVPDGVELDKGMLDGFKGIAKELKMDSKGAQKVLDYYVGTVQEAEKQIMSNWNKQKADWREAASKDKEIGGEGFKQNLDLARKVIDKVGGPALKQALRDLDIGNHPEIIRFMYRVGKALSEDSLSGVGDRPAQGKDSGDEQLRKAFPSMYSE